jgi:hypothetical protein
VPSETHAILSRARSLGWELVGVTSNDEGTRDRLFRKRLVSVGRQGVGKAAAAAGVVGFAYFESGPDLDLDGDVDGGLLDDIENLFG